MKGKFLLGLAGLVFCGGCGSVSSDTIKSDLYEGTLNCENNYVSEGGDGREFTSLHLPVSINDDGYPYSFREDPSTWQGVQLEFDKHARAFTFTADITDMANYVDSGFTVVQQRGVVTSQTLSRSDSGVDGSFEITYAQSQRDQSRLGISFSYNFDAGLDVFASGTCEAILTKR